MKIAECMVIYAWHLDGHVECSDCTPSPLSSWKPSPTPTNHCWFQMEMKWKIPALWFLTTNSFSSRIKYPLSVAPSLIPILTVIKIPLLHNLVTLAERMHNSRETSSGHLRLF